VGVPYLMVLAKEEAKKEESEESENYMAFGFFD
jgi:ribosomal protein L12E/L44/L45/RPP1/RPP2